ncbi:hypothetical protein G6F24_017106 [Rhizopus arrhizus]|nr:hypothetical protein G6F24_017106 [Rhizopus arrhizus]
MLWSGLVEPGPITIDLKNKCGGTGPWPTVADFNGGHRHRTGPQRRLLGRQACLAGRQAGAGACGGPAPDGPSGRRFRPDRKPRRPRRKAHFANPGLRLRNHAVRARGVFPV